MNVPLAGEGGTGLRALSSHAPSAPLLMRSRVGWRSPIKLFGGPNEARVAVSISSFYESPWNPQVCRFVAAKAKAVHLGLHIVRALKGFDFKKIVRYSFNQIR